MRPPVRRPGFTLVELLVVVLIIGILAAFAIPQYLRSVETSKADDAVSLANMVATTNRMYALDHANAFAVGEITSACNTAACAGGSPPPGCDLVGCKYLAQQDFDKKPYRVAADNPGANTVCNAAPFNMPAAGASCVIRRSGSTPGTNISPYTTWGYYVTSAGVVTKVGTNTPDPVAP